MTLDPSRHLAQSEEDNILSDETDEEDSSPLLAFPDAYEDVFRLIPDICPRPPTKPSSARRIGAEKVLMEMGTLSAKAPSISLPLSGSVQEALSLLNSSMRKKSDAGWTVPATLSP